MRIESIKVVLIVLLSIAVTNIQAEDIGVVGKVALGQKALELNIRDRSFSPTFNTIALAVTGTRDRYFLTLDHEFSIKDPIETDPNGLIFYSRTDTNLTFGYSWLDWLSVFVGFRTGETDAKYTGNNGSFGNSSDGFYIGASSSHFFEKQGGSLGVSFAIASLDGEVALSEPFVDTSVFIVGTPPPGEIQGSAIGFSLGVTWTGQVSEDTLYNISAKLQRFEFEDDVVFGGLDLTYEENSDTLSIGLTHFFE